MEIVVATPYTPLPFRGVSRPDSVFMGPGDREQIDYFSCVHCGDHVFITRDTLKMRGFCQKCAGPYCRRKHCQICIPIDRRLELVAKGVISDVYNVSRAL